MARRPRLSALALRSSSTRPEEESIESFDRLTRRAVAAVGADAGYVSLLSGEKQFLRGCVGLPEPLASERETPLEQSLCAYALDRTEPLVIDDVADDPDFEEHPAVEDRGVGSCVGVPLVTDAGETVGTFCVVTWEPRPWADEEVETVEIRFRHADGSWRILEAAARSLPEDSSLGAILASSRDVTERWRTEESLRLLAAAVENAGTGVLITGPRLDPPGPEIRYVNEAMTEISGYAEEELVGSTPRILQGPETERAVLDHLAERLEAEESFEGRTVNYRKDGTPYHVRWKAKPIFDDDGTLTHFVSVQEDVTEQVRREELLEKRVRERTRELDRSQSEALGRLARAAEYRDDETGRHTQRVGRTSAVLARCLGRDEEWVERIREAAPLHDIGKIGIADQILLKPGQLSDDEYRAMKMHAEIGAELLSGGRSELFGMADAFDAMTNDRPYRDALPVDRALEELRAGAGSQFDPRVVSIFLEDPEQVLDAARETSTRAAAGRSRP